MPRKRGKKSKSAAKKKEDKLVARARARQKKKEKKEKKAEPTLAERLKALPTLPEFFERVYYSNDAELEDGHRVVQVVTEQGVDIRVVHVFFEQVLGTDFVIALQLEATPGKKKKDPVLFDDVSRCAEIERKLNTKRKLAAYTKAKRVVMFKVLVPVLGSRDWDVKLDLKPIIQMVRNRLEHTMMLLDLSTGLKCPLCGISPPCSHFSKSRMVGKSVRSRKAVHTLLTQTRSDFAAEHGGLELDFTEERRILRNENVYRNQVRHPERFDGTLKYNYNHLRHLPDGRVPQIPPLRQSRCKICTLPLPRGSRDCPSCEKAPISVAIKRHYTHKSASYTFNLYCDHHGI